MLLTVLTIEQLPIKIGYTSVINIQTLITLTRQIKSTWVVR